VCGAPTNSGSFTSWVSDPCGGLVFESFFNITGTPVANLTSAAAFPNSPNERLIMSAFDTLSVYPDFSHDNYGGRVRGLFIPPASGNWIFYLASDDASQLFLNPNGPSAAGKVLIQQEAGCCGQWAGHASAPQPLIGGRPYYIEGLYKES